MRICVFGAGSIGSCIGGMLARENEVTLIGRKANVDAIRDGGLTLQGAVRGKVTVDARESISGLPPPDLLIVATKAYATSSVIEACQGWVADRTVVLTVQNGLGNLEKLHDWHGRLVVGGTTTMGAFLTEPGTVRIADLGRTVLGSPTAGKEARQIASVFRSAGIPTRTTRDIRGEIWSKAIVNASINPMSAVLRVTNGELIENRATSRLLAEVCGECELVADGCGIDLPYRSMYLRTRAVARRTASNRSSMLRDIELGRKTEISNINGEICRLGLAKGVRTPLNSALVAMVESLEKG